jgi:hypothetical protein
MGPQGDRVSTRIPALNRSRIPAPTAAANASCLFVMTAPRADEPDTKIEAKPGPWALFRMDNAGIRDESDRGASSDGFEGDEIRSG